jgi:hypothetical protein
VRVQADDKLVLELANTRGLVDRHLAQQRNLGLLLLLLSLKIALTLLLKEMRRGRGSKALPNLELRLPLLLSLVKDMALLCALLRIECKL